LNHHPTAELKFQVILPKVGSELAVAVVSPTWSTIIRDVARLSLERRFDSFLIASQNPLTKVSGISVKQWPIVDEVK
jgi:hypothetical protein